MANRFEELSFVVPPEIKKEVEAIALDRSEPGNRTTNSDVLREALAEYLDVPLSEIEP